MIIVPLFNNTKSLRWCPKPSYCFSMKLRFLIPKVVEYKAGFKGWRKINSINVYKCPL